MEFPLRPYHTDTIELMRLYAEDLASLWEKAKKTLKQTDFPRQEVQNLFSRMVNVSPKYFILAAQIGTFRAKVSVAKTLLARVARESELDEDSYRRSTFDAEALEIAKMYLRLYVTRPEVENIFPSKFWLFNPSISDEKAFQVKRGRLWDTYSKVLLDQAQQARVQAQVDANTKFMLTRFEGDVQEEIEAMQPPPGARVQSFKILDKYDYRIITYAEALWVMENSAFKSVVRDIEKEYGLTGDIWLDFIGPADSVSCTGCKSAVFSSPYPASIAPVPGTLDCYGNCRHALIIYEGQITDEMRWRAANEPGVEYIGG